MCNMLEHLAQRVEQGQRRLAELNQRMKRDAEAHRILLADLLGYEGALAAERRQAETVLHLHAGGTTHGGQLIEFGAARTANSLSCTGTEGLSGGLLIHE